MAQGPVGMILTRYLSSEGWVEECSHANAFDADIDERRRCVLRGCPYLLVDAETGGTVSVHFVTVFASVRRRGGFSGVIGSGDRRKSRQDGGC